MTEHLNLALVESLQTLITAGSFHRAAAELHITPPAMTQQIRRLEDAVGFALVDRSEHPLRLTARGEVFMLHAREALDASRRALGIAERATVRIGFLNGYPRTQDEAFLARFRALAPDVSLVWVQLDWGEQITRLISGDVDATLARPPYASRDGFESQVVHREGRVVALPVDSPLAARETVRLSDLDGYAHVRARGADAAWTHYWAVDPRPDGSEVAYDTWAATMEEALVGVAMAGNIMITARSVAERYSHPGLVYRDLVDADECTVELCTRSTDRRAVIRQLRAGAVDAA